MKKLYLVISVLLNFIFGFLFGYALLGVLITVYSINCLFNGCSDMVEEEWVGIVMGLVITLIISGILFPMIIFTNRKFLHAVKMRKKHYFLVIPPFFILGTFFSFYLRSNHSGPF
ncbi:hypothetical protein COL91_11630 [Bacillus pseudomycoides]|nr:hypothetical protein COO02_25000 [Bacillus pseudomycoides]PGA91077.1 hypothetical protein COL91_11630 [Bacillus pseudomycoides]PHF37478.1 hypothetical protein COF72_23360 [Bacillus pseudomycoides]